MEDKSERTTGQARCPRRLIRIPEQKVVREMYDNKRVQSFIGLIIMGNFVSNCVQKQIDPYEEEYPDTWYVLETTWNIMFVFELIWNVYGRWFWNFILSSWNIFDVFVVALSIPSMAKIDLGPAQMLRMLRAFRVFRLFKRFDALRKILVTIERSVMGVISAGVVTCLVMCIYANISVDLFSKDGKGGLYTNVNGRELVFLTPRGLQFGDEYFGTLGRSLYTCFQVLIGDSWAEMVGRLNSFITGGNMAWIFYLSFQVICGVVLINVIVAVLLDNMVEPAAPCCSLKEEDLIDPRFSTLKKKVSAFDAEFGRRMDELTSMAVQIQKQLLAEDAAERIFTA